MAFTGAALLGLPACGDDDEYRNELRPPAPINISAVITERAVSVSPAQFGAGLIVITVTNQSDTSQEVTFRSDAGDAVQQTTGPINPRDTAQLKVNVPEGDYLLRTGSADIRPATIMVGPERPSAQNEVLLP